MSLPRRHVSPSLLRFAAAVALASAFSPGSLLAQTPKPAVPVELITVAARPMPVVLDLVGTAQAIASIPVKTRIDSQIESIGVGEGDRVKAGQVIFTLDARAIGAQIAQARAVVARDRAQLALVNSDLERTAQLVKTNTRSARDLESAKTLVAAQEATIAADQAALDNLEVLASYYVIRSPIDGRVGSLPLKPGSSVRAADSTLLATINQIDPIHVAFAVPQASVTALRGAMAAGEVQVEVRRPGDGEAFTGRVSFIENTLEGASGTLGVKAVVANPQERLLPGEYVRIRVTLRSDAAVTAVPDAAIQMGQNGAFVWVVGAGERAEIRRVRVDRTVDAQSVVSEGLAVGDRVVTDGHLRLAPGVTVAIKGAAAPVAGAAPAPATK